MIDPALLLRLTAEASSDGVAQLVVGAIVANSGKVLLLKRPADDFMGGIFELPSGKVEPGEDLAAALVREVAEETGLRVVGAGAYLGSFDYTSGSGKKSRQFNFVVAVDSCEPVVLQEHDEYLWMPVDEEMPVTDAVRKILETFQQGRSALQVTTTTADRSSAADLARSAVAAASADYLAWLQRTVGP